jgi:hypothetical protein
VVAAQNEQLGALGCPQQRLDGLATGLDGLQSGTTQLCLVTRELQCQPAAAAAGYPDHDIAFAVGDAQSR